MTLKPGESVYQDVLLWQDYRNEVDVCLPSGEFRFESSEYELANDNEFTWGFTLSVE